MPPYILYHANCFDGFGAACVAWRKFGNDARYFPCKYGDPLPSIPDGSEVYFLDFSAAATIIEDLARRCSLVAILDHHVSASESLCTLMEREDLPSLDVQFNMHKSGAVLAWEYFFPGIPIPKLILYIQDRDLWKFDLSKSREVAAAFRSYPFDFKEWYTVFLNDPQCEKLASDGENILRFQSQQVNLMCKAVEWLEMAGYKIPVVNASAFFSEVGERLLQLYPDAPFSAYWFKDGPSRRQWGLRGRQNGVDVSEIAKQFGGGGHAAAAGFVRQEDGLQ